MAIECAPLPSRDAAAAPGYFKQVLLECPEEYSYLPCTYYALTMYSLTMHLLSTQALLECDEEWSQHKKLYTTKGSVRGVVPPGFAYFDVAFGLQEG